MYTKAGVILGLLEIFGAIRDVVAHGTVSGVVIDGTYYPGYSPSFQFQNPPPTVIGWPIPEDLSNGFIDPANYTEPDIICHLGATPGATHATIAAGSTVELQWTPWPESHKGPVIDYLANCNGPCESVDKTTLEFFKIDGVGLINDDTLPGTWASDQLIANNNSWIVEIPSSIVPGNYVLRHEIIALHLAETVNGAQNYPQCINLEITGSGTDTPVGTLGTALYGETDSGIEINIYQTLASYVVPGPSMYSGAVSLTQSTPAITGVAPSATAAPSGSSPSASTVAEATTSSASLITIVSPEAAVAATGSSNITLPTLAVSHSTCITSTITVTRSSASTTTTAIVQEIIPTPSTVFSSSTQVSTTVITIDSATTIPSTLIAAQPSPTTSATVSIGTDALGTGSASSLQALIQEIAQLLTTFYDSTVGSAASKSRRHARDIRI